MNKHKNSALSPWATEYLVSMAQPEIAILQELRVASEITGQTVMLTPPQQLKFIQLLVELKQPKRILEIGTFTGLSALAMALACPQVQVDTCDISTEHLGLAQKFWEKSGIIEQINTHIAPALDSLARWNQEAIQFDIVYIDADKQNNYQYALQSSKLLAKGGIMLVDNTLSRGAVSEQERVNSKLGRDTHQCNEQIRDNPDWRAILLPIGDGLTLISQKE